MHIPDAEQFAQLATENDFVPVHRRLLSDTLTPVTAFQLLDDGGPACLFESVIGGEKVGRYSFLAANPIRRFSAKRNQIEVTELSTGASSQSSAEDPLDAFRPHFHFKVAELNGLPPFVGGAIGYAGYDVVRYVENLPNPPEDDRNLPDLDFAFYHTLCVFDHVEKTITVVSLADCREITSATEATTAYQNAVTQVDNTIKLLSRAAPAQDLHGTRTIGKTRGEEPLGYIKFLKGIVREIIEKCEHIRAGDIFQVVPSQRLSVRTDVAANLCSLRVVNPSPFMFYVRTPECELVGCSPEIMCRVNERLVTVRPLAGTRKRGETMQEDKALEKELLADPKERAEHVMLVDLGRNDVGRVAQFGSVELTEIMVVERYSHVMHISSEVQNSCVGHHC